MKVNITNCAIRLKAHDFKDISPKIGKFKRNDSTLVTLHYVLEKCTGDTCNTDTAGIMEQGKSEGLDSCDRPSNLKLDSNRQFFHPCDREIWWMTSKNNRTLLLYYVKLCASFQIHWWIQTGFTVQKRSIRVGIGEILSLWPWNLKDDLGKQ